MKNIPISAGRHIAEKWGYDQVIIIARKVDTEEKKGGEHMTTYGVNKLHCKVIAKAGRFLQEKVMGWFADENNIDAVAISRECLEWHRNQASRTLCNLRNAAQDAEGEGRDGHWNTAYRNAKAFDDEIQAALNK